MSGLQLHEKGKKKKKRSKLWCNNFSPMTMDGDMETSYMFIDSKLYDNFIVLKMLQLQEKVKPQN